MQECKKGEGSLGVMIATCCLEQDPVEEGALGSSTTAHEGATGSWFTGECSAIPAKISLHDEEVHPGCCAVVELE